MREKFARTSTTSKRQNEMHRSETQLLEDALAIWHAGVNAVRGDRVIERNVVVENGFVTIGDSWLSLDAFDRIVVVGAGKACAAMTVGLERALARLAALKPIRGWVNVPVETVRETRWIHLNGARPAAVNLPTPLAVQGTEEILRLLSEVDERTWCIVLISGGGSALLPAPIPGLSLEDKIELTQTLSARGADIVELNTLRRGISRVKGGGLLRAASRAARVDTLVISDVLGDPIDAIASGPTVESTTSLIDADEVLQKYVGETELAERVRRAWNALPLVPSDGRRKVEHRYQILANLAEAVDAAGVEAEKRGYSHAMTAAAKPEGDVFEVAKHWASVTRSMLSKPGPDCWISGGEPTVTLAPAEIRGLGGRNQQLVLEAWRVLRGASSQIIHDVVMLSGGTDGEDGPTHAAGAWLSAEVDEKARAAGLDLAQYALRNDGCRLFESAGGLLVTGPTDTNVCDLRVVVLNPAAWSSEAEEAS